MESINERIENGILLKFKPITKSISLFDKDNKPLARKEFIEWSIDYPLRVVLDIESSCNSGCKYCSYGNNKSNNLRMPKEKVFQILDEAEKMKVFELSFRGGEPTIHPDFEEIWGYAQSKKFLTTNVITNGLALDNKKVKKLLKYPNAKIIISFDGFPETNNLHRNPQQYNLIMSWLPAILKEYPYQIVVLSCLYGDSKKRILEFLEYLAELGLKFHDFSPLRIQGDAVSYDKREFLSLEDYKNIQNSLNNIKDKFENFRPSITLPMIREDEYLDLQNFPVPLFNETYRNTTARITVNGDVIVSTRICSTEYIRKNEQEKKYLVPFGNIFKDSLENVWLSSKDIRKKQVEIFYKNALFFLGF